VPKIHPAKKKKAFRLRLEGLTMAEVARQCGISSTTIQKLENGWTDEKGVRHPGWKDDIERLRREDEQAERESGLALKEERIKAYERLAKQAIDLIEKQFPNIKMKNASDAKALISEVRELGRLISIEKGEYRPGKVSLTAVKADITVAELERRYEEAQAREVEEIEPPREAHYDGPAPDDEKPE
jgi:transcriptional regulator with XRE-family HTH domain